MTVVFQDAQIFRRGVLTRGDAVFSFEIHHGTSVSPVHIPASSFVICPGFVDVHVHLREPGFSYKETMSSGTQAAAHGGYTTVCAMPNLDPVPDSLPHLEQQLALIRRDAAIRVLPYGSITRGQLGEELSDMAAMTPYVAAFSDDGRGVQSEAQMRLAMETAKGLHKLIVAHCEDNSLLHGGYIHDGAYARTHGHRGICSESEWGQIRRDLELVRQTGCGYHVCHISTKESVALIRRAKAEGLDVTCETAPHYLLMDETMLQEDGRFKMNPPLRSPADREALLEGLADGTIDMIATDHAPHSAEEKAVLPVWKAPSGIIGLETALGLAVTELVKKGHLTTMQLVEKMCVNPAKLYHFDKGYLAEGKDADIVIFNENEEWTVTDAEIASKSHNTPFIGTKLFGRVKYTICGGKIVYKD